MGDLLDPNPPQWRHRDQPEDVAEDRVIVLVNRVMQALTEEVDSTIVYMAALRLAQKTITAVYQQSMGAKRAEEMLQQATELAAHYVYSLGDGPSIR